jgi:uncharacterized membrane protein YfcA
MASRRFFLTAEQKQKYGFAGLVCSGLGFFGFQYLPNTLGNFFLSFFKCFLTLIFFWSRSAQIQGIRSSLQVCIIPLTTFLIQLINFR